MILFRSIYFIKLVQKCLRIRGQISSVNYIECYRVSYCTVCPIKRNLYKIEAYFVGAAYIQKQCLYYPPLGPVFQFLAHGAQVYPCQNYFQQKNRTAIKALGSRLILTKTAF